MINRTGFHTRTCAAAVGILIALLLPSASARAEVIFDELMVLKGLERQDGVVVNSAPYFFEFCISGTNISNSTLPKLQTPVSETYPEGSEQTLTTDGDDEFCLEVNYTSSALREDDFPNGSYSVTATNLAGTNTDSKTVTFSESEPTAYASFSAPENDGTVSTTDPTNVSWSLTSKGSCDTGSPETCLDAFVVGSFVDEENVEDDEVFFEIIFDPASTGTVIPGSTFEAGTGYEIEVETVRGAITDDTTDDEEEDLTLIMVSTDLNLIRVTGEVPPQPIQEVFIFKGFDRDDGIPLSNPYFFEVCVIGTDIPTSPPGALPTVETPVSVDFPLGSNEVLESDDDDEFCFEAEGFADAAALENAYPSGDYTVTVTDNSSTTDTVVVTYNVDEPSGFPDIFDPIDGAMVSPDVDLAVQWGELTAKGPQCNPSVPDTCADGLFFFAVDELLDEDVKSQILPNDSGGVTVSASLLQPGRLYGLEVESFRGPIQEDDTSDTLGKPILVTTVYEDINLITVTTVPEPGGAAMQLVVLACVAMWRRRGRSE